MFITYTTSALVKATLERPVLKTDEQVIEIDWPEASINNALKYFRLLNGQVVRKIEAWLSLDKIEFRADGVDYCTIKVNTSGYTVNDDMRQITLRVSLMTDIYTPYWDLTVPLVNGIGTYTLATQFIGIYSLKVFGDQFHTLTYEVKAI